MVLLKLEKTYFLSDVNTFNLCDCLVRTMEFRLYLWVGLGASPEGSESFHCQVGKSVAFDREREKGISGSFAIRRDFCH